MQAIMKRPLFSGSAFVVAAIVATIEWLVERYGSHAVSRQNTGRT